MRPITNTSKKLYVTINIFIKLLTSLIGLSALSTFGDSESEIGSSSYTCQYKLFIRFKDYSYKNVVQYVLHNINKHYILDTPETQKEPRKTKDKLEGQLKLFIKCKQCVAQNMDQWRSKGKAFVQRQAFNG